MSYNLEKGGNEGAIHFRAKEEQSIVLDTKTKKLLSTASMTEQRMWIAR
ncbi:hypothetical protein [Paenibacillus alvei]|nr:hypothetical protein [Paenibacillus alvei]NEZ42436.1 hypothetical protein [Paenibacillus alvei]